ncbi:class I SAM-dependent methyltransferase [bacterium]|nr:class I SAM-dependent methyltransferase [bacterium]
MNKHFEGWKSEEHKITFDVWNKMSKSQFKYIFSSFEENKYLLETIGNKEESLLDYGCSSGYLKRYLNLKNKKKINYTGFDISEKSIKIAKEKYGENNFFDNLSALPKKKYDLVYSRDTILHQIDPWKFLEQLASKTKKNLILRLRTRDKGATLLDVQNSCQLIKGDYWVPYIVLNYDEFLNNLKKLGFKFIKINRSYTVLGGYNKRFLERSLYLKETGTSETSVLASFERNGSKDLIETLALEGHNLFKKNKITTLYYKILNKINL